MASGPGAGSARMRHTAQTDGPKDGRSGSVPVTTLVQPDNPWRSALWVRALQVVHYSLRHVLDLVF